MDESIFLKIPRSQWRAFRTRVVIESNTKVYKNVHEIVGALVEAPKASQADPLIEFLYEAAKLALKNSREGKE